MDGLTAIAKSTSETASYFKDENNFITEALEKILTILEDTAKSNTINEKSSKNSPSLSEEIDKRKKINSSLKTGAKNVTDMKSDVSDRIGAVVIVATLTKGFNDTVKALNIQTKSLGNLGKDNKKDRPQKIQPAEKGGNSFRDMFKSFEKSQNSMSNSFTKTFNKALGSLKSLPSLITSPFSKITAGIKDSITKPFAGIKNTITSSFKDLKGFFSSIPQLFGKMFGGIKNLFGNIFGTKKKNDKKGGDINAVAIVAGDTMAASQYIKSFNKLVKDISKVKTLDTKALNNASKGIKNWAKSFNKDIINMKIDSSALLKFSNDIRTTAKTINSISLIIIKSRPLSGLVNKLFPDGRKNYLKGLTNYARSLNKLSEVATFDSGNIVKIAKDIGKSSISLIGASIAILAGVPYQVALLLTSKLGFSGIINWVKNVKKIEKPLDKFDSKKYVDYTKTISKVALSLMAMSTLIIATSPLAIAILPAVLASYFLSNGINSWVLQIKEAFSGIDIALVKELSDKTKLVKNIAMNINLIAFGIIAFSLQLVPMFLALKFTSSFIKKHEKSLEDGLSSLALLTGKLAKVFSGFNDIKPSKVAGAIVSCMLMTPLFINLAIAMKAMKFAAGIASHLKNIDKKFTNMINATSTMLNRLSDLKKELGWGIATVILLSVFATALLTATTLLFLTVPMTVLAIPGLLLAGVLFAGLILLAKLAKNCLKGAFALIVLAVALAVMSLSLLVSVKLLAKVGDFMKQNWKMVLFGFGVMAIVFAAVIALGAIAPYVLAGAGALAAVGIAVVIATGAMLLSVMMVGKIKQVIDENGGVGQMMLAMVGLAGILLATTVAAAAAVPLAVLAPMMTVAGVLLLASSLALLGAFKIMEKFPDMNVITDKAFGLAKIFGALAIAGLASIVIIPTIPLMLASSLLLIPTAAALFASMSVLAKLPDLNGISDKISQLIPIYGEIGLASLASVVAAAACIPLSVSMLLIGKTMKNVFKKFIDAGNAAAQFDSKAMVKGLKAIDFITKAVSKIDGSKLKSGFKGIEKGIKEAPSKKNAKKFVDAMRELTKFDANTLSSFTDSFNKSFESLSSSKDVVNSLASSIHALNNELVELSKKKDSVKILKDVQKNTSTSSSPIADWKSKFSFGSNKSTEASNNGAKSLDDIYALLSEINNKIEGKKSASWKS